VTDEPFGDRYPPGTSDADVEEAFGDGEEPITLPPPEGAPPWRSPEDDRERGWPDEPTEGERCERS
jgi:hypothetical protein